MGFMYGLQMMIIFIKNLYIIIFDQSTDHLI